MGGNKTPGILSIPPGGYVRIVSRQIEDTVSATSSTEAATGTVHYKWSLIGERNWQNPKADKTGFVLGDVYPLNSTTKRGGCNIWECDLTAARPSASAAAVEWHLTLHGSNGQTALAEGIVPQPKDGRVEDVVRVVQTRDEPVQLPIDVVLARIGEQDIRLKVAE